MSDKKPVSPHLLILVVVMIMTALLPSFGRFMSKGGANRVFTADNSSAATCNLSGLNITSPAGYTFTPACVAIGESMYTTSASDTKIYTYFSLPSFLSGSAFIKSGNIVEKEDRNLNWSLKVPTASTVYVLYRKIPGQGVPSWLSSSFQKVTNDDFSNLQQFALRKNDQGLIGVYDIYQKAATAQQTIQMGPASNNSVTAFSMYLTLINSNGSSPLPSSSNPSTTTPIPTSSSSQLLYVDPNGNDSAAGTSAAPFKTIAKAVSAAGPGTEIRIRQGTYAGAVNLSGKKGTPTAPIILVGDSAQKAGYPVIDAGGGTAFNLTGSAWISLERLKVVNSGSPTYAVDNSSYIVIRRNITKFFKNAIELRNNSNHILAEYNEFWQFDFAPDTNPRQNKNLQAWSALKGSQYEGGAFTSFGGAGMNIIRFNYIHDVFNGVYMYKGSRSGDYMDANVWVGHNRFERVVDDPFEPETIAYNSHFYNNLLVDTHRMVSLAPLYGGPLYIYNNAHILTYDITREAASGRHNASFKVSLGSYPTNGVFIFNNSTYLLSSSGNLNGYGNDMLSNAVNNFQEYNNAFKVDHTMFSGTPSTSGNSLIKTNIAWEGSGSLKTDPLFVDPTNYNLQINASSPLKGGSSAVNFTSGFTASQIIPQGDDIGAYRAGSSTGRSVPEPKYVTPAGGEYAGFDTQNLPWPADARGGENPPSGL